MSRESGKDATSLGSVSVATVTSITPATSPMNGSTKSWDELISKFRRLEVKLSRSLTDLNAIAVRLIRAGHSSSRLSHTTTRNGSLGTGKQFGVGGLGAQGNKVDSAATLEAELSEIMSTAASLIKEVGFVTESLSSIAANPSSNLTQQQRSTLTRAKTVVADATAEYKKSTEQATNALTKLKLFEDDGLERYVDELS